MVSPCNWDRTKSLEALVLSFPGIGDSLQAARIPLFGILKHDTVKHETYHDVMSILAWSLRCLAEGRFPGKRHDGSPFGSTDWTRQKKASEHTLTKGALVELRGDWAFYKQVFKFPQFNERAGCCWRCNITPGRLHEVGPDAPWRAAPLSHWQLLQRWASKGVAPSPLFSAPGVRSDTMVLDWLHIADLGVTCDFAGNLFAMTVRKYSAPTAEERCKQLYQDIDQYYQRESTTSRLDMLTPTMIQAAASTPPKLRAKAAEARLLVPFLKEHALQMLGDSDMESTVKAAAHELETCYSCLSKATFSPQTLKDASRRFCILCAALARVAVPPAWRLKPKVHLFQEMNETCCGVCPSDTWTYRDEDFGGTMAAQGRRRGGAAGVAVCGRQCLLKFCARHRVLAVLE